jgi:hypothetical protein
MSDAHDEPRLPVVAELGERLLAAARAREANSDRGRAAGPGDRADRRLRRRGRALRHGRVVPLIAVGLLALSAVALAARAVIQTGSPAQAPFASSTLNREFGKVLDGSGQLLALRVSDPAGGPPWGMRVLSTTRGLGCAQVGRVVGGRLGVLGEDRAFHDDGRFHELPANVVSDPLNCTALDAAGRSFQNTVAVDVPSSGWTEQGSCDAPLSTRGVPAEELCAEADERVLYYGQLGPRARSVSYRLDGRLHTVATVGPQGAYLIVIAAAGHDTHGDFSASGTSALLNSPITQIGYSDGSVCRIWLKPGQIRSFHACPPVGYTPIATPKLTRALVASPVHVRLRRSRRGGRWLIVVEFRARQAVSSARSSYVFTLRRPPRPGSRSPSGTLAGSMQGNIARGGLVHETFSAGRPGSYSGMVFYVRSSGAGALANPLMGLPRQGRSTLVGRFAIRIPR